MAVSRRRLRASLALPRPSRSAPAPLPAHLSFALARIESAGYVLAEAQRNEGLLPPAAVADVLLDLRKAWSAVRGRRSPVA